MIQQIGSVQQSTQAFSKNVIPSTDKDFSKVLISSIDKLETNEVDASIYNDLKNKYNIRSATFEELKEMANDLYEAGAITLLDVSILTFDHGRATQYMKQAVNGQTSSNFTMYETNEDSFGRRDWIAEFEARAVKDRQYGNFIGNANKTKIISILKLLERQ